MLKLLRHIDTKEIEKIATIKAIRSAGLAVRHVVVRHGLEETEAFAVEAALIDYIENCPKTDAYQSCVWTSYSDVWLLEPLKILN
jgi:hypothetical protein